MRPVAESTTGRATRPIQAIRNRQARHRNTSGLTALQRADLVDYLRSLDGHPDP
jgi:hypothetical protein